MTLPNMVPVDSSKIKEIGYDAKEEALFVRFKNDNSVWRYWKVILSEFDDLLKAESIGVAHAKLVKNIKKTNRVYEVEDNSGEWIMK